VPTPRNESTQKMIQVLRDNPGYDIKSSMAEFQRRHSKPTHPMIYYKAKREIEADIKPHANGQPAALMDTVEIAPANLLAPNPPDVDSPFVSAILLDTIGDIKRLCDEAGGLEVADQLAVMVGRTGSVPNFRAVIELLRQIDIEKPATLPAEIAARQ
jgi:hypothetical protein